MGKISLHVLLYHWRESTKNTFFISLVTTLIAITYVHPIGWVDYMNCKPVAIAIHVHMLRMIIKSYSMFKGLCVLVHFSDCMLCSL